MGPAACLLRARACWAHRAVGHWGGMWGGRDVGWQGREQLSLGGGTEEGFQGVSAPFSPRSLPLVTCDVWAVPCRAGGVRSGLAWKRAPVVKGTEGTEKVLLCLSGCGVVRRDANQADSIPCWFSQLWDAHSHCMLLLIPYRCSSHSWDPLLTVGWVLLAVCNPV